MEKFEEKLGLDALRTGLDRREGEILSPFAAPSRTGIRRKDEQRLKTDYRQAFSVDVDRILHSLAYMRYIDKTQVFYLVKNDHITHRVLHVQLVSKISRTIGRFLGLNEDLIEAIALGHDIGHTPFGHDVERFLSGICRSAGIGHFLHNVQSVQFVDRVERKGKGWNLCLQTLDGILCHDGEIHNQSIRPETGKSFEKLEAEMRAKKENPDLGLVPMTLEGCVVRMADTISYIGRDIEDAIRLKMIRRSDLPVECVEVLGDTNGTIVYNLVTDVISNSSRKETIAFSPTVSEALGKLKAFNLARIYMDPRIKRSSDLIRRMFEALFDSCLEDIRRQRRSSVIFTGFLHDMSEAYLESHSPEEIARDFIAGMTDSYFLRQCPEEMRVELEARILR